MLEFIGSHSADLWLIISSVVTIASVITKLTPTPKDDAFIAKLIAFIALNKSK